MSRLPRFIACGVSASLISLAFASTVLAQSLTGGTVGGVVQGPDGRPLGEVSVVLTETTSGLTRVVTTSYTGRFTISVLPPGEFELFAERFGYRPQRITGIPVRPGRKVDLVIELEPAPPPVDSVHVVAYGANALARARAGESQEISRFELHRLPDRRRELADALRSSTIATPELEVEGLPRSLSGMVIDGVPYAGTRHPDLADGVLPGSAFPLSAFDRVELVTNGIDVEWSGFAGGYLTGHTRRGTRDLEVRTFGTWSGGGLWSSKYFEPGAVSHNALRGGFLMSGPIIRDTAQFILGIEAWRSEAPFPRAWEVESAAAELVPVARSVYGVDLEAYQRPRSFRNEAVSGFGRFDWQIAPEHALMVRTNISSLPAASFDPGAARSASPESQFQGNDLSLAASLASVLGSRWTHELRFGIERSEREYLVGQGSTVQEFVGEALPSTRITVGGLAFGADAALPGAVARSVVFGSQTFQRISDVHRLKFGLAALYNKHEYTYGYGRGGEFVFGGVDEFERREGYFMQLSGGLPAANFNVLQFAAFAQDTWNAGPGFDVTIGVRYEREQLPQDEIVLDVAWARRSGLLNNRIPRSRGKLSPRLGFVWDVQEQGNWVLRGGAGIYYDLVDPAILAELVSHSGTVRVRRGFGELSSWPELPDTLSAPFMGPRLALLGPDFEAPRTFRASVGMSRQLGPSTALHVSAVYRHTDFLPRRADINLMPSPVAVDAHGRPVYGTLAQSGSMVAAVLGSNRRFADYDVVSAFNPDGHSDYRAVTFELEHQPSGSLGLFARYTFSRTTDNWLSGRGGGPEAQLSPFPDSLNDRDWADGRSDFDVPHRLAVGAELRLPILAGVSIAGVYRYQSGYPFTPGFRDGVDMNGDGSGRNDPAFVDNAIPGTDELVRQWECLRSQVGRFVERNACRGESIHSLDARLSLSLMRLGRYDTELFVDGLNLIESDFGAVDRALYLVDDSRALVRDPVAGTVAVPLVANPNFGKPLARRTAGRIFRLGLRVNY